MQAKYALPLILALQVSMSLCEIPPPSQELVDKYEMMKSTFYKRLLNLYGRLQEKAAPMMQTVGETEHGQAAKTIIENAQRKPELQAAIKVASGLGEEVGTLMDKARSSALGAYEQYLRPYVGDGLSSSIDNIKAFLDIVMPAEPAQ